MTELLSGADAQVEVDALLQRHGISGPAAVAYFSFASPQSCIAAREDDGSITPLIGFWPLPVRGDELLESIAAIDGNGAQLVANYARRFPALTERIRGFGTELEPVRTESLGWLMGACSLA